MVVARRCQHLLAGDVRGRAYVRHPEDLMHSTRLLPFLLVAACSTGPSKDDSIRVFAATTSAATSAQSAAVADARTHAAAVPGALAINFTAPCAAGGSAQVTGSYDGTGTGDTAVFDLSMVFTSCRGALGDTVDGELSWSSTAAPGMFDETMAGQVSVSGRTSASCDFDMTLAVTPLTVSYAGTMC